MSSLLAKKRLLLPLLPKLPEWLLHQVCDCILFTLVEMYNDI
jgi:hypothetical protein